MISYTCFRAAVLMGSLGGPGLVLQAQVLSPLLWEPDCSLWPKVGMDRRTQPFRVSGW